MIKLNDNNDLLTKIFKLDPLGRAMIIKSIENLSRNPARAIATGIGIFGLPVNIKQHSVLLKIREEATSLISESENLQGKFELPGGGVDLQGVNGTYDGAFLATLQKELQEETGLKLEADIKPLWKEAISFISDPKKKTFGVLDVAFVTPLKFDGDNLKPHGLSENNQTYAELIFNKKIKWISIESFIEMTDKEFVSPRMAFLAREALKMFKYYLI